MKELAEKSLVFSSIRIEALGREPEWDVWKIHRSLKFSRRIHRMQLERPNRFTVFAGEIELHASRPGGRKISAKHRRLACYRLSIDTKPPFVAWTASGFDKFHANEMNVALRLGLQPNPPFAGQLNVPVPRIRRTNRYNPSAAQFCDLGIRRILCDYPSRRRHDADIVALGVKGERESDSPGEGVYRNFEYAGLCLQGPGSRSEERRVGKE